MINRKSIVRAAGAGAAAAVAMGLFSTGAANADTFVPLPGGEIVRTLSDGTVVTVRLVGESANINPSMGSTPVHRNAWVSASAQVELSGSGAKGGKIYPGYVVGCQVNIGGGGVEGGVSGEGTWDGESFGVGAESGGELSLGPGQAKSFYVLDLEEADDFGEESHEKRNKFKGKSGSVTWADETIGLSGCAGYAQARAFVKVKVETENVMSVVTLWGQPFSIG
ncbi:MspA family porin [Nocardia cyriacigeorgica]|uniref:MspA family porin n=1 Tax=Nocardia cyriacigeorgica TaxID=135487 RepID=UPI0013D30379|nr:MspA family porin [Nocardia cyriacigeorgica]MBF6436991.1 MspA family porin [Nocardia cyriacigeorgica]MBF6452560.1 MspA family porin [Nocardia cyriacigeorgica]MBF6477194.1 MspA family porin [Nocardia cyriacigeorgica]MBF6549729.1 MspA family porin [Nocardia cyriacigeorgica]NEW26193.1 MspA family porin [Nocardia cyriacigeorgica]